MRAAVALPLWNPSSLPVDVQLCRQHSNIVVIYNVQNVRCFRTHLIIFIASVWWKKWCEMKHNKLYGRLHRVVLSFGAVIAMQCKHFMCCGEHEMVGLTFFVFWMRHQTRQGWKGSVFPFAFYVRIENSCRLYERAWATTWSNIWPQLPVYWNGFLLKFTKSRMSGSPSFLLPFCRGSARLAISMIPNALYRLRTARHITTTYLRN